MKLLDIFNAAIEAVGGEAAVRRELLHRKTAGQLGAPVYLVAIGKAASEMTEGALAVLGESLQQGLVLTKYDHVSDTLRNNPDLQCHESAHPVPDAASLQSGTLLTEFVTSIPSDAMLLVLLSGGASSLVEQLPPGMTLAKLAKVNQYLLSTGLDITQMNSVRRSLSCIKGGRLGAMIVNRRVLQLAISDVPGDRWQDIGSGPFALADAVASMPEMPAWITELQQQVPAMPGSADALSGIESQIIASSDLAKSTAQNRARELGEIVYEVSGDLHNDVGINAEQISQLLLDGNSTPGMYIWAGESTVKLPDNPGRGGRNQHLAALLAREISGHEINILCCATDGTDGPTVDAGGYVNGETLKQTMALGLNFDRMIERADSGNMLEQVGGLVTTGPTGTNVMDLVIAEKR